MKKTILCSLLEIQYPIIQAPMAWVATAELAAAVSEAGGLGTIGPNAGMVSQQEAADVDAAELRLREQIRKARTFTKKPFAVNLPVGWGKQRTITDRLVEVAVNERISIAVVSMGSPEAYTVQLKEARIKVIHVVGCVEHAAKAQEQGVDAVVCSGCEGGGHLSKDELTTLVLVPQVVDAVKIPVIAGGGIGDARGVVAALALGAQGVYMGTRFLATKECTAHSKVKETVVNAHNRSTVVFARKTGISRNWKNRYTESHIEMETKGASFEDLRSFERSAPGLGGWRRVPAALLCGNIEEGSLGMGADAGLIREIVPAGHVIEKIVREYDEIVNKLE